MKRTAALLLAALMAGCGAGANLPPPSERVTPSLSGPTTVPTADVPTSSPGSPAPTPTSPPGLSLVVVGDSIPFGGHFCPNCVGFVDQYAKVLETKTGYPVQVNNLSRDDSATMAKIETQVSQDAATRAMIAASDVVLVSVGYNNALPDASTGVGCGGDMGGTIETYIVWALATKPACLQAGVDTYAAQYDRIFSAITDLRNGKPTLYAAINVHDGNLGDPAFVGAKISAATRADLNRWIIAAYERWNPMLCAKAKQHGFACVDVYHAFNGPKGDVNSDANTIDHAHPSQAGNDLITALLAKVDLSKITH